MKLTTKKEAIELLRACKLAIERNGADKETLQPILSEVWPDDACITSACTDYYFENRFWPGLWEFKGYNIYGLPTITVQEYLALSDRETLPEKFKIHVMGRSKEVQEHAFNHGYKWASIGSGYPYTDAPYLFFTEGSLTCSYTPSIFYNERPDYTELTVDEFLSIPVPKEEKPEPKFKPFDRVLVRNSDYWEWRCSWYSHQRPDEEYLYQCTCGVWWKQCIPYEGNEHLVGTNNKPE